MIISDLLRNKIGILGFGREGRAVYDVLCAREPRADVVVFGDEAVPLPPSAKGIFGPAAAQHAGDVEVMIRSPGFSPSHAVRRALDDAGIAQTTSTNLFLSEVRLAGLPVIGITGSKGKSTTSTLTHLLLQKAGIPSALLGNIGDPAIAQLQRVLSDRLVTVLELSSYQCSDLPGEGGPTVACLLDLFPEHLDWHGGADAYYAAKLRIAESQCPGDTFLFNASSSFAVETINAPANKVRINDPLGYNYHDGVFWYKDKQLFTDKKMRIPGAHNRRNAVAALAIGALFGASHRHMASVLSDFAGLPFRLHHEGVHGGIRWINDSISTAPESAAAAIEAYSPGVYTLITGGQDRGYTFAPLLAALEKHGVKAIVLLPETGAAIETAIRNRGVSIGLARVESLEQAVQQARARTPHGATCVFSPGAPSYHQYASFEERGKHFHRLVSSHG